MKLEEYMNSEKFPVTSQKGLSAHQQIWIDAFNFDQLEEAIARGYQMNEMQVKARAELQSKRPWMAEVTQQVLTAISPDKVPHMANTNKYEAPAQEADDEGEGYAAELGKAILEIVHDEVLSIAEKRKKILCALRLMDEDEMDEGEPLGEKPPADHSPAVPATKPLSDSISKKAGNRSGGRPLRTPVEPFKKLSAEELKTACEQVHKILKVTRAQEQRNRDLYREIYGEEMPDM